MDSDRTQVVQENPWKDPRFIISMTIIAGFAVAYIHEPSETMNGALIAGFAGAWGYWLGSSSGARESRSVIENAQHQTNKALDLVEKQTPVPEKPDVVVQPGDKVVVAGGDGEAQGAPPAAEPSSTAPKAFTVPEEPQWPR